MPAPAQQAHAVLHCNLDTAVLADAEAFSAGLPRGRAEGAAATSTVDASR
jgi:hypothetical protein